MTSKNRDATGTQLGLSLDLDPLEAAAAERVVRAHDARHGVSSAATADLLAMLGLAASAARRSKAEDPIRGVCALRATSGATGGDE